MKGPEAYIGEEHFLDHAYDGVLVRDIMQTERVQGDSNNFRRDRVFNGIFHYLKNFTGA